MHSSRFGSDTLAKTTLFEALSPTSGLFGTWAKCGACGRRVLASDFTPSFPTHLFLPSSSLFFVILPTPSQNAAGGEPRAGSDAASGAGGAATTPGTALGPGGCHPRGQPGLSRAPARTPQHPNTPPTGLGDAGVSGMPEGPVEGDREGRGGLVDRSFLPCCRGEGPG